MLWYEKPPFSHDLTFPDALVTTTMRRRISHDQGPIQPLIQRLLRLLQWWIVVLLLVQTTTNHNGGCCWAQLSADVDCTLNGGPAVVSPDDLRGASLGGLSAGNIIVLQNGTVVASPDVPVTVIIGVESRFSVVRQEGFQGFLFRTAGVDAALSFTTLFNFDDEQVGKVSFCSALNLLVSNWEE